MVTIAMKPHPLIERLRQMQYVAYTYEEFVRVLKKRLRIFTGREEIAFYNENQIADLVRELRIMDDEK